MTGLALVPATAEDIPAVVALRNAVAERLTRDHGHGHWSSCVTERGVLQGLRPSRLLVARDGPAVIATPASRMVAIDARPSRRPKRRTSAVAANPPTKAAAGSTMIAARPTELRAATCSPAMPQ